MLFGIGLVIFVIICVFLCLLILIQSDKGGGISGALGGGFSSATNLLGSQDTANILTRATAISAGIYLGTLPSPVRIPVPSFGRAGEIRAQGTGRKTGEFFACICVAGSAGTCPSAIPAAGPAGAQPACLTAGIPARRVAAPQTTPAQGGQVQSPAVPAAVPAPAKGKK